MFIANSGRINIQSFGKLLLELTFPLMRMQQRILPEDIARSVVIHHHIHFGGFDQIGIDVDTKEVLPNRFSNTRI